MTPPCYNVEVAYSFKMGYGVDMDAVLADYARGHQAVWVASDCNPRTGKRCNCDVFECPQRAVGFIDGLPDKFDIDEAGITRDGKEFTLIFPYPRESMGGDPVYDVLNASFSVSTYVRRFIGAFLHVLKVRRCVR